MHHPLLGIEVCGRERKYDKKYYCLYCKIPQLKLPRHISAKHKDEVEVQNLLSAKGDERQKLLTKIRNLGNHHHNIKTLKDGLWTLYSVYRGESQKKVSAEHYIPCKFCFGWSGREELWKHIARCPLNTEKQKKGHVKAGALLKPVPRGTSEQFQAVLTSFQSDEVSLAVKNDKLLRMYGERLTYKYGHDTSRHMYIRSPYGSVRYLVY